MTNERAFYAQVEELEALIATFQSKVAKQAVLDKTIKHTLQQYKLLQKELEKILCKQFSTTALLEDDDWRTLLEQSPLTAAIKEKLISLLEANKDYKYPKDFIQMVEQFYKYRYSNHQKYLDKLHLGIEIDAVQYQSYLNQAVTYTLKQRGLTTKAVDLSANLIMLLKGRLKTEEKGVVLLETQFNSTQFNLSLDSKDIALPKLTQKLNELPLLKKWAFGIEDSVLSASVTGVAAYDKNKYAEINLPKIKDSFGLSMDVLTSDINASLNKLDLGGAVAIGDTKLGLAMGDWGTIELGVKIADFSASLQEGADFVPVQLYGKWELAFEDYKKRFESYAELMKLTTLKVEVVFTVKTSIGLKADMGGSQKVQDAVQKVVKAQEEIVGNQQTEYLKKQETYNDLIEKKENIRKIQKENKYLDRLIDQEYDPAKKKKLLIQRGKRKIKILKDYKAITEHLKREGAGTLEDLKDQVVQKSKALDTAIKKTFQKYDQVLDRITKPANKLVAELLQKQASKRMLSLLMKAVPGLNVISLAVDIYDAYTLVSDISTAYMEADTDLEVDEELEKLALANAEVDINDMPDAITSFLWGIGAGGRLIGLKKKEVDRLQSFFEEHFPDGDESTDFANFMFNYGDYYDMEKKHIKNIEKSIISFYQNQPKNLTVGVIEELEVPFKQTGEGIMFKNATYVISDIITTINIGDQLHVKALGRDKKGKINKQIPFEFNLWVIDILENNNYLLQMKKDLEFQVVGFRSYQLRKEARFIYDTKRGLLILE